MKYLLFSYIILTTFICESKFLDRLKERKSLKGQTSITGYKDALSVKPGDYLESINVDNEQRYFKIHIPVQYDGKKRLPVLFALHGGGGHMDIQANDRFYHQISQSDKIGYIVVFPNGYSRWPGHKLATWNAGKCCGAARDKNIDDVGFFKSMIQFIDKSLQIDKSQLYLTGMSNGAMMSYRLACEMDGVFKAIAAVAGTDNTSNCSASGRTSILHIHAKNDDHVLFDGGLGPKAISKKSETSFTSVKSTIEKWVKMNKCQVKPRRSYDLKGAYCDTYEQCQNKTKVQLCVTEDGGHSWPGGNKPKGGSGSTALDANDVMWTFFTSK